MEIRNYAEFKENYNKAMRIVNNIHDCVLHSEMFGMMDLKMHDSFYTACELGDNENYIFDKGEMIDFFYRWCDDMYDSFIEDMKRDGVYFEDMITRVNRTSKFFLCNDFQIWNRNDITQYIDGFIADYSGAYGIVEIAKVFQNIHAMEEYESECIYATLEYILNDFETDFKNVVKPVKIAYDYIVDMKKNQEEYFSDWMEFYVDEKYEMLRIKEEKEKAYNEKIDTTKALFEWMAVRPLILADFENHLGKSVNWGMWND